jgi:hypothetical protein
MQNDSVNSNKTLSRCVDGNSNAPSVDIFEVLIIVELVCVLDTKGGLVRNTTSESTYSTVPAEWLFYFILDS